MLRAVLLTAIASLAASLPAFAGAEESYPARPIRLIVPFTPGGGSDSLARIIAPELAARLKQPVVIENKPGAGGSIGIDAVAKSASDGYTIGLASPGSLVTSVTLMKDLPYDPVRDLTPVALIADLPIALVATKAFPGTSVSAVISADKANPGSLNFASAGVGTTMHLSGELFNAMAGTRLEHVPYKGAGLAIADLITGRVQLGFLDIPAVGAQVASGDLKLLAVGNARRAMAFPDVPTIAESGIPGYETSGWFGIVTAASVSPAIVARLYQTLAEIMALPTVRDRLITIGIEPTISNPEQFGSFIRSEIPKWAKVIKDSGATAN
jgi:tripartite-type tricarboxylate transporter receptor subunit TctC